MVCGGCFGCGSRLIFLVVRAYSITFSSLVIAGEHWYCLFLWINRFCWYTRVTVRYRARVVWSCSVVVQLLILGELFPSTLSPEAMSEEIFF